MPAVDVEREDDTLSIIERRRDLSPNCHDIITSHQSWAERPSERVVL
jgi:hypothetical protein